MNRAIVVILGTLVIVIGLFFLLNSYIYHEKQATEEVTPEITNVVTEGVVTEVNTDQIAFDGPALITFTEVDGTARTIAVPSMGINLCAAAAAIADVSLITLGDTVRVSGTLGENNHIVPCESADHYLTVERPYENESLGIAFSYRVAPEGYVLTEPETDSSIVDALVLQLKSDVEMMEGVTETEAPPAMSVYVYENTANQSAQVWVDAHPSEANTALMIGESTDTVVGGANAVAYTIDGLYPARTIVVLHGSYVYVLTGAYLDVESTIAQDFMPLVASFMFIPREGEMEGTNAQ